MKIGYVRVSSVDQNEARQLEALKQYGIEKWYIEKISGKNTDRPELQQMLEFAREGDTIYVEDFSRLARSTRDLLDMVEMFQEKGIELVSMKENLDTSTPTGKLLLTMIAAINEFERKNILERQREGIEIAKREGKFHGRKPINVPHIEEYYRLYMTRQTTKTALAKELGVCRATLNKLFDQVKNSEDDFK